jgi:hypothetical protein
MGNADFFYNRLYWGSMPEAREREEIGDSHLFLKAIAYHEDDIA